MKSKDIIITDTDMCPFELVDMDFNMVEDRLGCVHSNMIIVTVKSDVYNRDRDYIENRYIYTGIQPKYVFQLFRRRSY